MLGKELYENKHNEKILLESREKTKLEIRKKKVQEIISNKKKANLINVKESIDPDCLNLNAIGIKNEFKSLKEILIYLFDSYYNKNYELILHSIYILRCRVVKDLTPEEIEENIKTIYNLIDIIETFFNNDTRVVYEILWIYSVIFHSIQNNLHRELLLSHKLILCIEDIFNLSKSWSNDFKYVSLVIAGNSLESSKINFQLICGSKIPKLIANFIFTIDNIDPNHMKAITWFMSLISVGNYITSEEIVSFIFLLL